MKREPEELFQECLRNPNTAADMTRDELVATLHFACDRWLVAVATMEGESDDR